MPLSLTNIYNLAPKASVFNNGHEYYKLGNVIDFATIKETPNPSEQLVAVVRGNNNNEYSVVIQMSDKHEIKSYMCSCPNFEHYEGVCKHIIATLLFRLNLYNHKLPNIKSSAANSIDSTPKYKLSDKAVSNIINQYIESELTELADKNEINNSNINNSVKLTPTIHYSNGDHSLQLSLTIGCERQYVVKSIFELCQNFINQHKWDYGKNFSFTHKKSLLDETSKSLISLVISKVNENSLISHRNYYEYQNPKHIYMTPDFLDKFFNIYVGYEINFISTVKTITQNTNLLLINELPNIIMKINKATNGINLTCYGLKLLFGEKFYYVIQDNKLFRCDESFSTFYTDFLSHVIEQNSKIFIALNDMAAFFSAVIPYISKYVTVLDAEKYIKQYSFDTLETEVYLDAPTKNEINAQILFCYKNDSDCPVKINIMDSNSFSDSNIHRNFIGELKSETILKAYFPEKDSIEKHSVMYGSDNDIYYFVSEVLPKLSKIFTIYATDKFKKIGLMATPKTTVGVSVTSDLLEIDFSLANFPMSELEQVLASYRKNKKYHRLSNGSFLNISENSDDSTSNSWISQISSLVDGLNLNKKQLTNGQFSIPKFRAMFLDNLLSDGDNDENSKIQFIRDSHFRDLIMKINDKGKNNTPIPKSLENIVRNYQKVGFEWLKNMEEYGFCGILADDMGLGKTLQIITMLLYAKETICNTSNTSSLTSLIVCPTSLVLNWEDEFKKFAPSMRVLTVIGNAAQRLDIIKNHADCDVLITSYDLLKRDFAGYEDINFYYQIIDEAQFIKNHTTKAAQGVKVINSKHRCALTGTPIENRLSELWSIFDFLMPHYLHSYLKFKEQFELPVVKNGNEVMLTRLNKMVAPFILRRLKKDVLKELPEKTETVHYSTMTDEQEKLYYATAAVVKQQISDSNFETNKIAMLAMLTRLRQICCDPALCYENYTDGSGKLEACMELIHEAASGGHKVLLFSQFTSMLEFIRRRLEQDGISFYVLQGSTKKDLRRELVNKFNNDSTQVFLISLKAGGTGLNLTSADIVIHYDPWWNIATQNQATDRAHRIGQENPVTVYKLIAKGTIEEKIVNLQETKKALVDSVIKQGDGMLSTITKEQLLEIL